MDLCSLVCVCACVNGRVTHVHIYMHVESRRQLQILLLRIQLLCFLRKKFSLGSGDHHLAISIVWLANEFLDPSVPASKCWDCMCSLSYPKFYVDSRVFTLTDTYLPWSLLFFFFSFLTFKVYYLYKGQTETLHIRSRAAEIHLYRSFKWWHDVTTWMTDAFYKVYSYFLSIHGL